jgi:hypothetical protein
MEPTDARTVVLSNEQLARIARKEAWTPEALIAFGLPRAVVYLMVAAGPKATPERARLSVTGRRRSEPTTCYIWGPDIPFHLGRD